MSGPFVPERAGIQRRRLADRRSGWDRRSGLDRRRFDRRRSSVTPQVERRGGEERRFGQRRSTHERRRGIERRALADRRRSATMVTQENRDIARRLPDEFMKLPGPPIDRVTELVTHSWPTLTVPARAQLARTLLLILEPLLKHDAVLTDWHRDQCERIVINMMARRMG